MIRTSELVRRGLLWTILLFLVFPRAVMAEAEEGEELPSGRVLVSLDAGPHCASWVAEALAQNIEHELDGYERLAVNVYHGSADRECADSEPCLLRAYGESGIDIVMRGTVTPTELHYQLFETWTPARVDTGVITIGYGSTFIDLKQQILRAFRPILSPGGLLDQSPYLTSKGQPSTDNGSPTQWQELSSVALTICGALATMLVLPLVACWFLLLKPRFQRLIRLPTVWVAAMLFTVIALLAGAIISGRLMDLRSPLQTYWTIISGHLANLRSPLQTDWKWIVGLVSGCIWGVLLLDALSFGFAPLYGIERVGHRHVFRLIKEWFYASLQRLCFVALFYVPVGIGIVYACRTLSISTDVAVLVVAPAIGLFARYWVALLIECLTLAIDDLLIRDVASDQNPWHSELRRYFMGYVKRTGWNIDSRIIEKTLFLPACQTGVLSYGGGFIENRIAVSEEILLLAMGDIENAPHEERRIRFPTWSDGIVAPAASTEQSDGKQRRAAASTRRDADNTLSIRRRLYLRRPLGQAATLLGYVVPTRVGELIPLIADDGGDLAVVRELLAEHYAWFEPDPDEEDDDTDPSDRDFLFGALAREIGAIERRDHQVTTLFLAWELWTQQHLPVLSKLWLLGRRIRRFFTGRFPEIVADAYAALHFARDHVIQYLFYMKTGERHVLTSRADPETLAARSQELLQKGADDSSNWRDRFLLSPSIRNRLVWLSRLCDRAIGERRELWLRRILNAAIAAVVIAALGLAVKKAVEYHPLYEDRIAHQEERIREIERENNDLRKQRSGTHGNAIE